MVLADTIVRCCVRKGLHSGFRHIDCSSQPDNEEEIGEAMEEIFSDWIVNRPDVFVTAKLTETQGSKIPEAISGLLKRLRTKYVDLLLLQADQLTSQEQLEVFPSLSFSLARV